MARSLIGRGPTRHAAGASQQNGDAPQSTLTSKLVDQIAHNGSQHEVEDGEAFRSLLAEVLDGENDSPSTMMAEESILDINYKLIYVITKAGLDSPGGISPFQSEHAQVERLYRSIRSIEVSIRRSPAVLFYAPDKAQDPASHDGILILWLTRSLLCRLVAETQEEVIRGISDLFETIISVEQNLHIRGVKPRSVQRMLMRMVEESYARLADAMPAAGVGNASVFMGLSMESVLALFSASDASGLPNMLITCTLANIDFYLQALIVLTNAILHGFLVHNESQNPAGFLTSGANKVWAVGSLAQLWGLIELRDWKSKQAKLHSANITRMFSLCTALCGSPELLSKGYPVSFFLTLIKMSRFLIQRANNLPAEMLGPEFAIVLFELTDEASRNGVVMMHCVQDLLPALQGLVLNQARLKVLESDLQNVLVGVEQYIHTRQYDEHHIESDLTPIVIAAHPLRQRYERALGMVRGGLIEQPKAKRPRTVLVSKTQALMTAKEYYIASIYATFRIPSTYPPDDLRQALNHPIKLVDDDTHCSLLLNLGRLACTAANPELYLDDFECPKCDAEVNIGTKCGIEDVALLEDVLSLFSQLITNNTFQRSKKLRSSGITAMRRLLSHTENMVYLDLASSPLGQLCMGALSSSSRDIRLAAGRAIPFFLDTSLDRELALKNRLVALEYLRSMSELSAPGLQESCILAWGQIARHVPDGDELNLILLKLVEYLDSSNAFLSSVAYDELQAVSNHSPFTATKMFAPYWRTIAVTVIQDLSRRPQVIQLISELLGISVNDFLVLTQVHTIPYLVMRKRQDVLKRIADAAGQSIMGLCRDHNNMAAILSNILLQSSDDVEGLVMSLLIAASPEFVQVNCSELLRSEPQATATELLKAASENDELRQAKARQSLTMLASITHGKPTSSRSSRKLDVLGVFFDSHVLGIMALLADTINDGKGPQPVPEKLRCLGAIREMLQLAKSHVVNGLPQICACLRSAVENADLANDSFIAWIFMINLLEEDEISPLIAPTFALMIQCWERLSSSTQTKAYDMVSTLLKTHGAMLLDIVQTLPSLALIPLMSKFESELRALKDRVDVKHHFQAYCRRLGSENASVVDRALHELNHYLAAHESFLHDAATSEQPDPVLGELSRALLDTSVAFGQTDENIASTCGQCLGVLGCLDPTKIEAIREKKDILVLSNFSRDEEVRDFVIFFLREVLVKAFLSATNSRSQGFLAYAMQELLAIGDFEASIRPKSREAPFDSNYRRWVTLPESVRTTLTPFLDSKYFVTAGVPQPALDYPLYVPGMSHTQWIRSFAFDLLKRASGDGMIVNIFAVLSRIIRSQDTSIARFLIPFAALNVILDGQESEHESIARELLNVLAQPLKDTTPMRDSIIACSQTVFEILDYFSRWMQEKKKEMSTLRSAGTRSSRITNEADSESSAIQVSSVEALLHLIPADIISRRAVECKSYARALYHWEQYIRQQKQNGLDAGRQVDLEPYYERLQEIYTQIDEPDGIEGISSHLHVLNVDQQILEHRKAGRWTAAQSWYEMLLAEQPDDLDVQYNLLTSLKECGQYDVLLNQVDAFKISSTSQSRIIPFAIEASWVTGKWTKLNEYVQMISPASKDFNACIGRMLLRIADQDSALMMKSIEDLRITAVCGLSTTNTASLQECHESVLQLHVLHELETIIYACRAEEIDKSMFMVSMDRRLNTLGPFFTDKQYILGLRRAALQLSKRHFSDLDIASAWLTSAKLARKGGFIHQAFNAVLHASQLGDASATIEHSRLLWQEGNHRKAIQSLEGAISANVFRSHDYTQGNESAVSHNTRDQQQQNILKAKAHLLLAKWTDRAGQSQSDQIIFQYKKAIEYHNRWERGHYYLGKHYNKLLESEKAKPPTKQAVTYITGETAKLVVENYLRSLAFGAKYIYQTLPRILTLWLDLGVESEIPLDVKYGSDEEFRSHIMAQRRKLLGACNSAVKRYTDRLPAFVFYTALPQTVARICHPNMSVYGILVDIVAKVVSQHTPQALWTLLAMVKSSSKDRANRGVACMTKVLDNARKSKHEVQGAELKALINQGQRLSSQLLTVCEGEIQGKVTNVSLSKDLGFNHKTAASKLAMPIEACLTASLPTADNIQIRSHRAFSTTSYVQISSFLDDALVLNSLQRPRKISLRGSDGRVYALLCKPKDDLRKDQRLMEFNAMINRALKKDVESSKRRLYIKTYAVTPLNEECGLIEWVDNLKTLREILLNSYKQKSVNINYSDIRMKLNEAISAPTKLHIFSDKIISQFPPAFHEWFVEMFPEPGSWFAARLRYTRSCAVMSIVGHVLGLGDRHGENILFEEGNGGTFHVDFNCLFDKGLTFEKPELVPFRLTHNMVDAFGAYGYEGPFRKSSELTNGILRQHEDTLMTILETFLYDPTTDFIGKKKKRDPIVPDTPEGVLENVRNKVRGLLPGESVPLGVEGYVDELIRQATDPFKLASMYIGWCSFF